jgi:hypothetical protein
MTLPRLPEYIQALLDVGHHDVLYVAQSYTRPDGDRFVWRHGGDLPMAEQRALRLMRLTHHVDLMPGVVVEDMPGSRVDLADSGRSQLQAWGVAL